MGVDEWQSFHEDFAPAGNTPGCGISVGKKTIAKFVVLGQDLLYFRAEFPHFGFGPISVYSKDRAKRTELKPPDEQFMIVAGCVLVGRPKKAADVRSPIGKARTC